jgi:hypothetical protein
MSDTHKAFDQLDNASNTITSLRYDAAVSSEVALNKKIINRTIATRALVSIFIIFIGIILLYSSTLVAYTLVGGGFERQYEQSILDTFLKISGVMFALGGFVLFFLLNYLQFGAIIPTDSVISSRFESDLTHGSVRSGSTPATPATSDVESPLERRLFLSTSRLKLEIGDLGRRGNTNLAIGILTTIVGVSILGYVVYSSTGDTDDFGWKSGVHTILRISIALFIQTFAYFFLRLYKTSLDDIKYYQNEITNIESKWLALIAATNEKDKALMKSVIESLVKTERNFILKKGDSTLGLERERLEKNEIVDLVKESIGTVSKIKVGK